MKRLAALALCTLLALSLPAPAPAEESAVPILGLGSYFPLREETTLTAWAVNALESFSVSDNYVLDWIYEKTRIRLKITEEFQGADAKRQFNTRLETAEELPDILLCTRWTKAECALYGIQGVVVPLDDYLTRCENWNRLNEICGMEHKADLTMMDGHIYCFGSVNECFHLTHQARMWVYQPWIDALCGGKLPETTAEFREYLQKVATMDPNGNGVADEIPLTGQIQEGWATDPINFLSNAFVHNNTIFGSTNQTVAAGCYLRDGRVQCNWAEEGYREALRYLADLYENGLLHSQVFTQNQRQLNARLENEPNLVGAVASGWQANAQEEPWPDGRWSEWTCLPPLAGPDGTRLSYQSAYDYFYNCNGLVTRACRDVETAVQLFDLLSSAEGTLVQNFGQEGKYWDWCAPDQGVGINGSIPLYQLHPEMAQADKKYDIWPSDVQIASYFDSFRTGMLVQENTFNGEDLLWQCALLYEPYSPGKDTVYPNIACSEENARQLVNYQNAIQDYVRQSTINFIVGGMNLDSDWDAYLTTLDILGQQGYRQLLQDAYDAYIAAK